MYQDNNSYNICLLILLVKIKVGRSDRMRFRTKSSIAAAYQKLGENYPLNHISWLRVHSRDLRITVYVYFFAE